MRPLINQGKLQAILLAIIMIFSSALAGCVTDDGTIITGDENETVDNNTGNESENNGNNATIDDYTDTDNDGYTDWCEQFWGTDSNVSNDFPHQQQTCDQNEDGIPDNWSDGWELNDTDNDGLTNLEEFWNSGKAPWKR